MRIGFAGSSGQGKTSTSRALLNRPEFMHYSRVGSTARSLSSFGLNKAATPNGQWMIMTDRILKELRTTGCYVSDRTPIDSLAYTLYQHNRKGWDEDYIKTYRLVVENHMKHYDHVFYFPLVLPVRPNAYREVDPEFHKEIDRHIQNELVSSGTMYIEMPEGTIEERAEFIRFRLYGSKYT